MPQNILGGTAVGITTLPVYAVISNGQTTVQKHLFVCVAVACWAYTCNSGSNTTSTHRHITHTHSHGETRDSVFTPISALKIL